MATSSVIIGTCPGCGKAGIMLATKLIASHRSKEQAYFDPKKAVALCWGSGRKPVEIELYEASKGKG